SDTFEGILQNELSGLSAQSLSGELDRRQGDTVTCALVRRRDRIDGQLTEEATVPRGGDGQVQPVGVTGSTRTPLLGLGIGQVAMCSGESADLLVESGGEIGIRVLCRQGDQSDALPDKSGLYSQRARVDHVFFRFRPGPRPRFPACESVPNGDARGEGDTESAQGLRSE